MVRAHLTTPTLGLVIATRPLPPDDAQVVGTGEPPTPAPQVVAIVLAVIRVPD